MADLEITVKYKSRPAKVALTAVVLLLPIWGILTPGIVLWITLRILIDPWTFTYFSNHIFQVIGPMLGLLLITILGVKSVLNLADNRIVISKLGIEFPFFLGSTFGLRRNFAWAAIRQTQLIESKNKREIVICTTDGFPVYMDVKCFAPEELEQLLLGLDVWAINCEKNPLLETLQDLLPQSTCVE